MIVDLLTLYNLLPIPLRSMAASLRGFYLRSWRYGPETDRLASEALEREQWDTGKWKTWQEERLAYVLHRAATQVPYYRDLWTKRRRQGDRVSWEYLENWPILKKDSLRENPSAFLADGCQTRKMFHEHTSGTSGTPLNLWWSLRTVRAWYGLVEARWRHWYGISRYDRWANIGGQMVSPASQLHPPFWVWNSGLNQLYMSSYHLSPNLIPHYRDALIRYRCTYLLGYSSSLYALAQEALRLKGLGIVMNVAVTNAEPLFEYQKNTIAKAFQCPVRETYGMAEIVTAASECEQGRLHLWPEVGWVEVFQNHEPVPPGNSGNLVCTGLLNEDMPLIRYQLGDRGILQPTPMSCACGRSLPVLASLEGRTDDVLYTRDGRQIGRLDPIFKGDLRIREAQIIQEKLAHITVRYIPESDFTKDIEKKIVNRLQARMGPVDVTLKSVHEIPRGANGKFRAVICKLSTEERDSLRQVKNQSTLGADC